MSSLFPWGGTVSWFFGTQTEVDLSRLQWNPFGLLVWWGSTQARYITNWGCGGDCSSWKTWRKNMWATAILENEFPSLAPQWWYRTGNMVSTKIVVLTLPTTLVTPATTLNSHDRTEQGNVCIVLGEWSPSWFMVRLTSKELMEFPLKLTDAIRPESFFVGNPRLDELSQPLVSFVQLNHCWGSTLFEPGRNDFISAWY